MRLLVNSTSECIISQTYKYYTDVELLLSCLCPTPNHLVVMNSSDATIVLVIKDDKNYQVLLLVLVKTNPDDPLSRQTLTTLCQDKP